MNYDDFSNINRSNNINKNAYVNKNTYVNKNNYVKEIKNDDSWYVNSQYIVFDPSYYIDGSPAEFEIFSKDIIKVVILLSVELIRL